MPTCPVQHYILSVTDIQISTAYERFSQRLQISYTVLQTVSKKVMIKSVFHLNSHFLGFDRHT